MQTMGGMKNVIPDNRRARNFRGFVEIWGPCVTPTPLETPQRYHALKAPQPSDSFRKPHHNNEEMQTMGGIKIFIPDNRGTRNFRGIVRIWGPCATLLPTTT